VEINAKKTIQVNAKTLKIHIKVCDQFTASLRDQDGQELKDYEGYVPSFFPGDHYGDYLILDIDIDTGQITNWEQPTARELEAFIEGDEE
jgi:hypothetical protein